MVRKLLAGTILAALMMGLSTAVILAEENDYFPLKMGDEWTYILEGYKGEKIEITYKVTGQKEIGKYSAYEVTIGAKDKQPAIEYYAVTKDRIVVVGSKSSTGEDVKVYNPPKLYLELPLKVGSKWSEKTKNPNGQEIVSSKEAIEIQEVEVPAGKFKALYLKSTSNQVVGNGGIWYAKGVGVVKMTLGNGIFEMNLIRYKVK